MNSPFIVRAPNVTETVPFHLPNSSPAYAEITNNGVLIPHNFNLSDRFSFSTPFHSISSTGIVSTLNSSCNYQSPPIMVPVISVPVTCNLLPSARPIPCLRNEKYESGEPVTHSTDNKAISNKETALSKSLLLNHKNFDKPGYDMCECVLEKMVSDIVNKELEEKIKDLQCLLEKKDMEVKDAKEEVRETVMELQKYKVNHQYAERKLEMCKKDLTSVANENSSLKQTIEQYRINFEAKSSECEKLRMALNRSLVNGYDGSSHHLEYAARYETCLQSLFGDSYETQMVVSENKNRKKKKSCTVTKSISKCPSNNEIETAVQGSFLTELSNNYVITHSLYENDIEMVTFHHTLVPKHTLDVLWEKNGATTGSWFAKVLVAVFGVEYCLNNPLGKMEPETMRCVKEYGREMLGERWDWKKIKNCLGTIKSRVWPKEKAMLDATERNKTQNIPETIYCDNFGRSCLAIIDENLAKCNAESIS